MPKKYLNRRYLLYHLLCLAGTTFPVSFASGPSERESIRSNEIPLTESFSDQRPLYNLAHMCNSIPKTASSLARGANGVEVDVTFRPDGSIILYHGYPCDCFRYCWDTVALGKYLEWAREVTVPGTPQYKANFAILYFDVKLTGLDEAAKYKAGLRFAKHLERNFFELEKPIKSTLKLVISISYVADVDFLRALISRLREVGLYEGVTRHLGFDVGMDTDSDRIGAMWRRLNVSNVWQGEGITNCVNPIIGHQLESLVRLRDAPKVTSPHLKKVYRWTIDLSDSIRSVLSYGIDGIMTNHPERVVDILQEPTFRRSFRLATTEDDPFERFSRPKGSESGGETTSSSGRPNVNQQPHKNYTLAERFSTLLRDLRDSVYLFVFDVVTSLQSALRR